MITPAAHSRPPSPNASASARPIAPEADLEGGGQQGGADCQLFQRHDDGMAQLQSCFVVGGEGTNRWYRIVIKEGRKRGGGCSNTSA